jgi:adenylate cyclase
MVQSLSGLSAPELVLRASAMSNKDQSLAGFMEARKLVDRALLLDPDLVPALILRAALINNEGDVDPNQDRDRIARDQDQLTARAVVLDPTDPTAWNWRGVALAYLGRWDAALEANAMAIKLEPYEARWYSDRAWLMTQMARPAEALALVDRALALDPANVGYPMRIACEAHLFAGQAEQAIATCEKATGLYAAWDVNLFLAAAYANHGELAKAAAAKAEALRTVPGLTIAQLRAKRWSDNPEYRQLAAEKYFYEGLRKAGFPER